MAGNMKKFQAIVREFTRFYVVSTIVEYFFPFVDFFCRLAVLLQQMANRSYLKSQKLKATEADRQKIALLEAEHSLEKDKAALEQRVRMLKQVIQKNRGNFLIHVLRFSFWSYGCLRPSCCRRH
jgi:hypothetical protein